MTCLFSLVIVTYNVFGGTLNPAQPATLFSLGCFLLFFLSCCQFVLMNMMHCFADAVRQNSVVTFDRIDCPM